MAASASMPSEEFCVVCGRTGRSLTDGVCAECAADRTSLVAAPQRAVVTLCPLCGARRTAGRWERAGEPSVLSAEDLSPFLSVHPEVGIRTLRFEETEGTPNVRQIVGHARVRFRGIERDVEVPFSVRIVFQTCTDCGRKTGRFYTAVLQLRGPAATRVVRPKELRGRLTTEWDGVVREARPDWRKAVSWIEERPEGWDVFCSDTLAARSIARLAKQRFDATVTESASLVGRKNGQDVYRVTFCVRFPRAAPPPTRPPAADPLEQ